MLLGVAFQRPTPVADALLRPAVELRRRAGAIAREGARVEPGNRGVTPGCLVQPAVPKRARVSEHGLEIDRDRSHREASRTASTPNRTASTPTATPTASIARSTGDPSRPGTKCWWSS